MLAREELDIISVATYTPRSILMLFIVLVASCSLLVKPVIADEPFEPNWESLRQYQCPDWFRDAKFGIYACWGPYTVPQFFSEWYSRWMYQPGHEVQVELSKAGQFFGDTYFRGSPGLIFRARSTSKYVIECTVCGKRFYRKKYSMKIDKHKDQQGFRCYGRVGVMV